MAQKMVFPLYSCWFQHHTIINTTAISHTISTPDAESGDVLPLLFRWVACAFQERQRLFNGSRFPLL